MASLKIKYLGDYMCIIYVSSKIRICWKFIQHVLFQFTFNHTKTCITLWWKFYKAKLRIKIDNFFLCWKCLSKNYTTKINLFTVLCLIIMCVTAGRVHRCCTSWWLHWSYVFMNKAKPGASSQFGTGDSQAVLGSTCVNNKWLKTTCMIVCWKGHWVIIKI